MIEKSRRNWTVNQFENEKISKQENRLMKKSNN